MEAYLQGQDLWDLISGDETKIPADTPQNAELRRKWKIKSGKALFALRTSISKEYVEHVRDSTSPKEGWKCMDPRTRKVTTSRDVIFDEVSTYKFDSSEGKDISNLPLFPEEEISSNNRSTGASLNEENNQSNEGFTRRSTRQRQQPSYLNDYEVDPNQFSVLACFSMNEENEPKCYEEARGVREWEEAMQEEISALNKNCTWQLVPKPADAELVTCKWVYKLKKNADGTIARYKARLVARGFSQQYGRDYEETFSPVARMVTIRTIISLAANKGWKLWQLDVKNAFLCGELDHDIFMEQPKGFVSKEFPDYVCLLKKSLYGLRQSPRLWFGFCGFKSSDADPSLFIKRAHNKCTMLLLYVDDMIITGDDDAEIFHLIDELSVRFEMKSLGEASCFLGLEIMKSDGYFVSQKQYAKGLLIRFQMEESKVMTTPMEPCTKLSKTEGKLLKDPSLFRQIVGSVLYLTITRPDIVYVVGVVSQFMDKPCEGHLSAAKRILRYVKGTLDFGLLYKSNQKSSFFGFVDADWAGDINDRRSTTGFCFSTGSAAITWCSKKQTTVALSSCEAEYVAASMATQECIWLKRLLEEIVEFSNYTVPIYCDNESAIKIAENPVFHARTKHIQTHFHFVREKVLGEDIEFLWIPTQEQVADGFAKPLAKAKFEVFRKALGVVDSEFALRRSVTN